jgi:hypothetical protein
MARQLTLIEFGYFVAIKDRELIDLRWQKDGKEFKSANLLSMVHFSNHVINWLISEVVKQKDNVKFRVKALENLILMGQVFSFCLKIAFG